MVGQNVTAAQVSTAAARVGLRADIRDTFEVSRGKGKGPGVRFGLKLGEPNPKREADGVLLPKYRYQRESANVHMVNKDGEARRVASVCWHGHRDFFRALWALAPGARVRTAQTVRTVPGGWYTADNFEAQYHGTGDVNIGSQMYPRRYADACVCHRVGEYDRPTKGAQAVPPGKYHMGGGVR